MTVETDFTNRLVRAFPELGAALDEHLTDQEGELLPYVFLADVARWLEGQAPTRGGRVAEMLEWLEREFVSGTSDVRNLIDVGIVEMLPASPEGDNLLAMLGPELRVRADISGLFGA